MRRVLFVDDEPRVLEGLQRLLRSRRHDWQMAFALGGEAALAELETAPFDVVVSDMRMPGMDGAALLKQVQARYPNVARIVLSGYTDREALLRAVPVAHQFLTKPCESEDLQATVERACSLQDLLNDEVLRGLVGEMGELPSSPRVLSELLTALEDQDVPIAELAKIVERDVAMCAKCLQLVNSAFFGLPRRESNVQRAIGLLGTNMLRSLAFSIGAFRAFPAGSSPLGFSLERLECHSLLTAKLAARLVPASQAEEVFMAAMLHDIGNLILAARLPHKFAPILEQSAREGRPAYAVEEEVLGVSHAEIGAYLLGLWGLPHMIVEAVAHHHMPSRIQPGRFDMVAAVHVANSLVDELQPVWGEDVTGANAHIDEEWLEALGVLDRLPNWRAAAQDVRAAMRT